MKKSLIAVLALSVLSFTVQADAEDERNRRGGQRNDGREGRLERREQRAEERRDSVNRGNQPNIPNRRSEERRDDRFGQRPPNRRDDGPIRVHPTRPAETHRRRWAPPVGQRWGRHEWGQVRSDRWSTRHEDREWLQRRQQWRIRHWSTNRMVYRTFVNTWWDNYYRQYKVPMFGAGSFMMGTGLLSDDFQSHTNVDIFRTATVSNIRIVALRDGATLDSLQLRLCNRDMWGQPVYRTIPLNVRLVENQSTTWINVTERYQVGAFSYTRPICVESFVISGYGDRTGFDEIWEQDDTQIVLVGSP